jgi:hypothetical protein
MWQRCGSHRGQGKSRFILSKVNKTLTLIGRTRTLSDVTDGRDGRTDAQTTLLSGGLFLRFFPFSFGCSCFALFQDLFHCCNVVL